MGHLVYNNNKKRASGDTKRLVRRFFLGIETGISNESVTFIMKALYIGQIEFEINILNNVNLLYKKIRFQTN